MFIRIIFLLMFLFLASAAWSKPESFQTIMGKPLNASDVPLQDEYFSWSINNQQWLLTADGTLTTTVNNIKQKIKLPLSRYLFPISQLYSFNTPDSLFLLYDTELAGDSAAFICRIKKYPLQKSGVRM